TSSTPSRARGTPCSRRDSSARAATCRRARTTTCSRSGNPTRERLGGELLLAAVGHEERDDSAENHGKTDDVADEVQEVDEQDAGDDEAEAYEVDGPVFHGRIFDGHTPVPRPLFG